MAYSATLSLLSVLPSADLQHEAPLDRRLLRAALRGGPIVLGTFEDPYQPAAAGARARLASFAPFEGLDITLTTASPLLLRDLDLLVDLDRRHAVTVHVPMAAPDPEQLEMIERLTAEGIAAGVVCTPAADGLGERALRRLFTAAREAGAYDVLAGPAGRRRENRREHDRFLALFRRLRLEHGFPRPVPGRG